MPTPDSLAPGDVVGPWRVERPAGRGTYGWVYRARWAGLPDSEPVALKLSVFPDDPRFVREVTLLSLIQHPAVPRFLDRGWWRRMDGLLHPYIVMQWVEGLPLYDWAELSDVSSRQVLRVLAQLARALEATHARACLHRDVKGDNIRVTGDGRAFLMDFGSGTWAGAALVTEGPMPPGTRCYRSPEAVRFHWNSLRVRDSHYEARPADDMYALGVAAYRLATGAHPPPAAEPDARDDPLRPFLPLRLLPQALNARVVPELAVLIEGMLTEAPQDRPSAREVAEAAEAIAERAGPEADLPLSGKPPACAELVSVLARVHTQRPEPVQVWRPGLAAAAMVGLLGLVGLCVVDRQPPSEPMEDVLVAEAEAPDAGMAQDGGTADLGDTAMTARAALGDTPVSSEAISLEVPEQPLPGQQRAPCRRSGEVEINAGCWKRLADITPPCAEDEYEWRGACYEPVIKRPRPPTTKKP